MRAFNVETERFGVKGDNVDPAGKNIQRIAEYMRNQLKEDRKHIGVMRVPRVRGASSLRAGG